MLVIFLRRSLFDVRSRPLDLLQFASVINDKTDTFVARLRSQWNRSGKIMYIRSLSKSISYCNTRDGKVIVYPAVNQGTINKVKEWDVSEHPTHDGSNIEIALYKS